MRTVNLRFYTIIYFIGIFDKVCHTWLKKEAFVRLNSIYNLKNGQNLT